MRIDAYNKIQQVYQSGQKVSRTTSAGSVASVRDQLQLSSVGKDIQTAKSAVAGVPDVREDVVTSLKERIQSGSYQVDTESFAAKLLEKYSAVV